MVCGAGESSDIDWQPPERIDYKLALDHPQAKSPDYQAAVELLEKSNDAGCMTAQHELARLNQYQAAQPGAKSSRFPFGPLRLRSGPVSSPIPTRNQGLIGTPMEYIVGGMITIAETVPFQRKIGNLLSDVERSDLIVYLADHPEAGVLIQGTGGIRKFRWGRQGQGKSGGIRVVYYFHSDVMPVYLLAAFGKNEKANLSKQEKQQLSKTVQELVESWRKRNE